ncbi:hypothetical protein ABK040_004543 [Willaertia magna]
MDQLLAKKIQSLHQICQDEQLSLIHLHPQMKSHLQLKQLEMNKNYILNSYQSIHEQLNTLDQQVKDLQTILNEMKNNINLKNKYKNEMIELFNNYQLTKNRNTELTKFLNKYLLNEEEKLIILNGKINELFFKTFKKVHDNHLQLTDIIRLNNNYSKSLFEILEILSNLRSIGYERLTRWIQDQCKLLNNNLSNDFVEMELRIALHLLIERPILLNTCLKEITNYRILNLKNKFYFTLTNQIEILAHDSIKYISELFTFLHTNICNEKELFYHLLSNLNNNFINLKLIEIFENILNQMVWRIEQVILNLDLSINDIDVIAFKIYNLLSIYYYTFDKLLYQDLSSINNSINKEEEEEQVKEQDEKNKQLEEEDDDNCKGLKDIKSLQTLAFNKFIDKLTSDIQQCMEQLNIIEVPIDLLPPNELKLLLLHLNEILNLYNNEYSNDNDDILKCILNIYIDPLINFLNQLNLEKNNNDISIYIINCYFLIYNTLSAFQFTNNKCEVISTNMEKHLELFTQEQSKLILIETGLQDKLKILSSHIGPTTTNHSPSLTTAATSNTLNTETTTTKTTSEVTISGESGEREGDEKKGEGNDSNNEKKNLLSNYEGMDEQSLKNYFHNNFYNKLFSLGSIILTFHNSDRLLSTRLKTYTKNRIASDIYLAYKQIYNAIVDINSGYSNPKEIVYHDPEQVKTLLDL